MKSFLYNIIDTNSEGEIGKPQKWILHVCFTMFRIAVCVEHCKCTCIYSREILIVLIFYFAPSLNQIDIVRRKMHYVQQILLYTTHCLQFIACQMLFFVLVVFVSDGFAKTNVV